MASDAVRIDFFTKKKQPVRISALGYDILLTFRSVGDLVFSSSRMVVCDPVTALDTEPFETQLPTEPIPLEFVFAELRDETILAYAVLRLQDHPAVRWQPARLWGGESSTWRDPEGFRVETSLVCVGDENAVLELMALEEEDPELYERALGSRLKPRVTGSSAVSCARFHHQELVNEYERLLHGGRERLTESIRKIKVPENSSPNIAIFDADCGFYPCHWGFDRSGHRTMFVIDFRVLDMRFTPFGLR